MRHSLIGRGVADVDLAHKTRKTRSKDDTVRLNAQKHLSARLGKLRGLALIYPDTHYHCTMDTRLFEEFEDVLKKARYMFTFENRPFGVPIELLGSQGYSWDLEKGIYSGYTVSYSALQLAVYMGFKQIFYLGLDLKHSNGQTNFFGRDHVSLNHEQTEFPKMCKWLAHVAEILHDADIKVYNCSMESSLTCFPKVSYEWALSQ